MTTREDGVFGREEIRLYLGLNGGDWRTVLAASGVVLKHRTKLTVPEAQAILKAHHERKGGNMIRRLSVAPVRTRTTDAPR